MKPMPMRMQHPQPLHDRSPWYREPWPWILMAGPAAVLVAGALTGWLAIRSYDGLVADDYYKQGLAVNQVLARGREAGRRGIEGWMQIDAGGRTAFVVRLASASEAPPETIRIALTHPTRAGLDQRVRAARVSSTGVYSGRIEPLAAGRWHVIVEDGAGQWRIRGMLDAAGADEVPLRPAQ